MDLDDREKSWAELSRILEGNPDLRGIFVANVAVHYIAEYLQKHAHDRRIFLVGYDLIEKNIAFLKANVITFLISQKPEQQGYDGIYALYRHIALKEKCPKDILMPIDIITPENVIYYKSS